MEEIDIQIQKVQRVSNKMNLQRPTQKYIITKVSKVKDKEKILKAAKEKQLVIYKKTPIKLSANFLTETFQYRRDWHKIFKVMKSKDLHPRLL